MDLKQSLSCEAFFMWMRSLVLGFAVALTGCSSKVVTLDEFNQIANGMSYSDVTTIIGESGTEVSSGATPEVPGVMESVDTKIYSWENPDGSNMLATFQNDALINKAQAGL